MLKFQFLLFLYMLAGFIANKAHILTDKGRDELANLMVSIVLPCMTFAAFLSNGAERKWSEVGQVLLYAVVAQVICLAYAFLMYRRTDASRRPILKYSTIISNYSYLGLPTAQAAFGDTAYFLATCSHIVYRATAWSIGVRVMTADDENGQKRNSIWKLLLNPCILALILGFLYMAFPIPLPEIFVSCIKGIAGCCTPLCMIIIGYIMGEANWKDLNYGDLFFYCAVRLLFVPLTIFAVLKLLAVEPLMIQVTVLQCAMPGPSTSVVFAARYKKDVIFAGQLVFVSTLLSLATVPLIVWLLMKVI